MATSLNTLGELYRVQRRYAEAEPLFRRALEAEASDAETRAREIRARAAGATPSRSRR